MSRAPKPHVWSTPTTLRRTAGGLWLMAAGLALAAEPSAPMDEGSLIETALSRPVVAARVAAIEARATADGTAPPALSNPFVEGRHEEARGPAGASTDAVTASWSFDLGFASAPAGRAASLHRASLGDRRRAAVTEVVCAVRHATLDLWSAERRRAAVEEGHERLERLVARLEEMAAVGEIAGYDVARVQIADAAHRAERDQAVVDAEHARTALSRFIGTRVEQVSLLSVVPHPALTAPRADLATTDPLLAALQRDAEAAELRVASAKRAAVPDLVVFGGARWDAPPGTQDRSLGWEAGAALEVPAFARNQQGIADAEAELAEARVRIVERESLLLVRVEAVARRLEVLGALQPLPSGDLWSGAVDRYVAGESSIDELLVVAGDVEAARIAHLEGERLRREAHLDLACTLADFAEPALRPVLEEALR